MENVRVDELDLMPDDADWPKLLAAVEPKYSRIRKEIFKTVKRAGAIGAKLDDLHCNELDIYKCAGFRLGLAVGMKLAGRSA